MKETARQLLAGAVQDSRQSIRMLQRHLRATEARQRAGLALTTLRDTLDQGQAAQQLALVLGAAAQEVRAATQVMQGAAAGSAPTAPSSPRPPRPRTRIAISQIEAQQQFADALRSAGLKLPGLPVMDGQRHYAPVEGNRGRQQSGAYMGFYDGGVPNGIVWNYKAGTRATWKATGDAVPLSPQEHRRLAEQAAAARAANLAAQRAREDAAAQRTAWLLEGTRPATPANAYLRRKGVTTIPPGVREDLLGNTAIPLRDAAGHVRNMQTILARPSPAGPDKLYQEGAQKTGTSFRIGTPRPGEPLGIAEGFATAWSAHAASGLAVLVALDTSNLKPLAEALRRAEPDRPLVLFADNDHHLPARPAPLPNAGLEKATAAADAVGKAWVIAPPLDAVRHAAGQGTDWNDHYRTHGLAATRATIAAALQAGAAQAAGSDPNQDVPEQPAQAQRVRQDQSPHGEAQMTDSKLPKAKAEVRQDRQREVDVWRDREEAGRAARQATPPRGVPGVVSTDDSFSPKPGARQRQAPGV